MKVLIVSTNRSTNPVAVLPMGACAVADAAAAAGHEVHFKDLMFSRDPLADAAAAAARLKPDVVGLSVRNIDNTAMIASAYFLDDLPAMVERIRAQCGATLVLGGAALGAMPEEILRLAGVSLAVTGAGEKVFPALLERLANQGEVRDLPGVAYLEGGTFGRNPLGDLARDAGICLAPDYRRWLDVRAYRSQLVCAPIRTKEGCHFRCVYCHHSSDGEQGVQWQADPERVADAVARHVAAGLRDIDFVDDLFNSPPDHAVEVCEAIARRKLGARLQCLDLSPVGLDDRLLSAMERAGFTGIGVTPESASDAVLRGLQKGFTARDAAQAGEVVSRHSIPCAWVFMLGGPGETEETVKETLRFAEELVRPTDMVFCNVGIRIFPGTELERIARREGRLAVARDEMLKPVFYVSAQVEASWIAEQLRQCAERNLNFIVPRSMHGSFMSRLNQVSYWLGVHPPLWRYTPFFNRALRWTGLS